MKHYLIVAVLAVSACGKSEQTGTAPGIVDGLEMGKPEVMRTIRIADFTMQEARQGVLSNKDLEGKVWVGASIFTHCPGICPIMTQVMVELQDEFRDDADFRLVSVTVDPARDTAEVLRKFAGGYGARKGRWYFVRNPDREKIGKFVKNVLYLPYNAPEPLQHAPHISLIGRDGTFRGAWNGTDPDEVEKLRKAIRKTLDAKKRS